MEVVKQFNQELSSLYETKPPISKAKMTSITKTAIKAIKFYKHVVQSVEKFIQKCKPEYKVPGLYVIDSIVRQSRHQFGSEKDVFAPRFARNILQTFVHLFNCPVEDKSKVIRVLNLWQKNAVFGPEVIQPLFDLADPNHPMHKEQAAAAASNGLNTSSSKTPPSASKTGSQNKPSPVKNDTSLWVHEQAANTVNTLSKQIQFDKKLLDFDYGEEDEDAGNTSSGGQQAGAGAVVDSLGSILSNPEVLRQLQNLQAHLSQAQLQKEQVDVEEKMRRLQEMKQQEEEFDRHLAQTVPKLPFAAECDFKPGSTDGTTSAAMQQLLLQQQQQQLALSAFTQSDGHQSAPNFTNEQNDRDERRLFNLSNQNPVEIIDLEKSESPHDSSESRSRRRRRSSSRTGNRTGGRSRSRSHSRSKRRRSRSWDREKDWKEDKEYDREKERERKKKGLPPLRKNHLSVCSTTLWIGHLSKLVQQEELSDTFGEFGDIVSIDLIPPRGCAFICMNRRQDANKALIELKYHKLHGKTITLAWAPGKGMKGKEWKDFWEVELGVSYIPWNKLSADTDFELLEEGGMFDEDTMPAWMKDKMTEMTEAQKKDRSTNDRKNFGDDSISQEMGMDEMMSVTPSDIPIPTSSHPGFIPLPDGPLPPTSSMGDIKPPPMSVGLQMPQMTSGPVVSQAESGGMTLPTHLPPMSIMSPFGMPRLLMGPGMLGNVPLGVPPPGLLGSPMMLNRMPQPVTSPFNQTGVLSQIPLPSPADKQKAALSSLTVPPPGGADGFGDGLLPLPFALPPHLRMPQGSLESSLLGPPISGSMDMKVDKFEDKSSSDELKDFMHNFDIPPPNLPGLFGTDTSVPPPSVNNLGPQPLMGDSDQRILLDQSSVPTEDKDDRHKLDRDKENDRDRDDRTKDRDFRNSSRDKENKDKDYRDRKERDHRDRERDFRDKDRDYRSRDRDRERDRDRDHRGERDREFRMNRDGRNDGMRDGRDARNEGMRDGRDARNEGMRDGRDGRNDRMRDGRADLRDRDNRDGRDNRNNRERFGRPDREEDRRGRSRERRDKPSRWSKDDDRPQDRRDRDISNENDRNFRNAEGMPINPRDDKGRRDKSPIRDGERHLMPGRSDENERDALGRPLGGPPGNMSLGPPPNGFLGGPPARHPPLLGPLGAPPLFGPRGAGPDGPNFRPSHPLDDFDRPPLDLLPPDFRPPRGEEFNEFDLLPRDRDDFPIRDRPGFDQRHPPPRGHFEDNFGPPSPFESRNRPDFFPHGLRGPGPIGPGTRGIPPLMGAPPGLMGLMFPPRGPPMGLRGAPRPGIWLDPPGGPNGFPSRGPPPEDMFLGSPFEEPPFGDNRGRVNPWKNRDDDRRRESEGNFGESRHGEFREARFEERLASESIPNERLQDAPQEAETVSEPIKEQATFKKPEESAEKVQPVDEQPQSATEQPPVVDERSQQVDERPQQVDERPQQVDEQPKQVDEGLQQVDEGPQQVDECPQQVDECPQQVDERPQLVTEQPQQVDERPQLVTEQPQQVDERPQLVTEQPQQVDERPQQVDECPQQVNEQPQQFGEQPQQFDEQPQQVDERPQQVDEQPQNFDEHSQRFDEQRQESNQQMYDNVVAMSETFEQMEAMPVEPTNLELNSAVPEIVTETDKSCEMPYRNIANCSEEALGAPEVASEIPSGNVNNNQETELMNRLESNPIELNDSSFKFPSSNEIPPQFDSNVSLVAESVLPDSAFEITPSEACPNLNETPEATINEPMVSGSCAEASIDGTANESDNVVAESA